MSVLAVAKDKRHNLGRAKARPDKTDKNVRPTQLSPQESFGLRFPAPAREIGERAGSPGGTMPEMSGSGMSGGVFRRQSKVES